MADELHFMVTGSRYGMSEAQEQAIHSAIGEGVLDEFTDFHHGDCVGVDQQMYEIVSERLPGVKIHKHPALVSEFWRANTQTAHMEYDRIKPLLRNAHMVSLSSLVLAFPQSMANRIGGTWFTINYAIDVKKNLRVIDPDGIVHLG